MAGVVVVFDFDRTLIDLDSDRWVVQKMGVTRAFDHLRPTLPWNALMNATMGIIHEQGKTVEDVAQCLKTMPLDTHIIAAIKSAYAFGCELRILSDANQFFIETILKHHGVYDCFSEIVTNPICIGPKGKLSILPFHDFISSPHGCPRCPPNLCKGLVLEQNWDMVCVEQKQRFIYLGDGSGDVCPCLKLGDGDFVMPRKDYPLWELLCNGDPIPLKAEIHGWSSGAELEQILVGIINRVLGETKKNSEVLEAVYCNLETPPVSSQDALQEDRPVRS